MSKDLITHSTMEAIADAIREKTDSVDKMLPSDMPQKILDIQTGVDISDTTATAADCLSDKYFYTADGTRVQGTIQYFEG